jgi:hypothetical protein
MAIGNWSSTKRDIPGKIISEVRGRDEIRAAIAKEQKPTSTAACQKAKFSDSSSHVRGMLFHNPQPADLTVQGQSLSTKW